MGSRPPGRDPLARLRHELRSPINQIIGYTELVGEELDERGTLDDELREDLDRVIRAARHLLDLIQSELQAEHFAGLAPSAPETDSAAAAEPATSPPPAPPESPPPAAELRKNEAVQRTEPRPRRKEAGSGGRVMVVDDVEANRSVLHRMLRHEGHIVTLCEDGSVALERLRGEPSGTDLVLLDILMPGVSGIEVLAEIQKSEELREVPVVMISALDEVESVTRCIELGAVDYLPKPFSPQILRARVERCLENKRLRDAERETHRALVETQTQLTSELHDAARYVTSLLPEPMAGERGVSAAWRYEPSAHLGGDAFTYFWLDDARLVIALLDVCGHGVGPALHGSSAIASLRTRSLTGARFEDPGSVLAAMNEAFQMDEHDGLFMTMWYGVYDRQAGSLRYGNAGHPPALLRLPGDGGCHSLRARGRALGILPGGTYEVAEIAVPPGSELLVFSDGVFEIQRPDGVMLEWDDFVSEATRPLAPGESRPEALWSYCHTLAERDDLEDDFCLVQLVFE